MNAPSATLTPADIARRSSRSGMMLGIGAFACWGMLPIYFKLMKAIDPVDIVANRVLWSALVLAVMVTATGGKAAVAAALRSRRVLSALALCVVLIAINWLLYVYAVNSGHILAGSLGYYLNPLANILLGRLLLSERLSRLQWAAVAVAAGGVAVLAVAAHGSIWLSVALCFSFAGYGLIRKLVAVEALPGLAVETMLMVIPAAAWLGWGAHHGRAVFGHNGHELMLLALSGIVSTTPLLLFTAAARRLPYSTVGMLQFIAPTLQFIVAVLFYEEALDGTQLVAFAAIWTALLVYAIGLTRNSGNATVST